MAAGGGREEHTRSRRRYAPAARGTPGPSLESVAGAKRRRLTRLGRCEAAVRGGTQIPRAVVAGALGGVHRRSTDDYLALLKSYSSDRFYLKRLVAEEFFLIDSGSECRTSLSVLAWVFIRRIAVSSSAIYK